MNWFEELIWALWPIYALKRARARAALEEMTKGEARNQSRHDRSESRQSWFARDERITELREARENSLADELERYR
jgi:hypothetical protein